MTKTLRAQAVQFIDGVSEGIYSRPVFLWDNDAIEYSVRMFVLEFKVRNPKPQQCLAIDEAIRTAQFVRNRECNYGECQ